MGCNQRYASDSPGYFTAMQQGTLPPDTQAFDNFCNSTSHKTASVERAFSAMRRIKTFLRSSMLEDRFTGLAHLHIHRDIEIPVEEIVNRFAAQPRKLNFGIDL